MSRKNPDKKKKREQKAAETATAGEQKPKGFRDSWEFKSAKIVLRIMGVLFFLGYLSLTVASAWTWSQAKWVLHTSVSALPAKADYYLNKVYKPEKLYYEVSLRPSAETEEIIKLLEPYTGRMSSYTFLLYSARLSRMGKIDDALFWWQFGRYRARFDALRCGSVEAVSNLSKILQILPHPDFPPDTETESMTVIKSLHKVLDYDAQYPAENIPEDICNPLRALEDGKFQSVGFDRWRTIRHSLRSTTEFRLKQMEEDLKNGTPRKNHEEEPPSLWEQLDAELKKTQHPQP